MKKNKHILGKRICVIGPSGSGKSTFSKKLSQKLNYPVLHLDQIAHIPHTNWVRAPREETKSKHDTFIKKDKWIIDGQYKRLMPQRLKRADSIILIRANRFKCLFRFFKRCSLKGNRPGKLLGATKEFNFRMIFWILFGQSKRWKKQMEIIKQYPHINIIKVSS
ncbi:MAG: AAA family ATPase, partial [Alphaproteobacteria bacterium]|nr:AAA family ATPase [Alphaproteobacteria bacterium]